MRESWHKVTRCARAGGASLVLFCAVVSLAPAADERRAGLDWWSLQPVRPVAVPQVSSGQTPINPIDRFILDRLRKERLAPSPEADRRTLIRRLSFDLIGLPPAPHEVEAFVA